MLDSADAVALAASVVDALAAPVDLRAVVPSAYAPPPFPLCRERPDPGEAPGGAAATPADEAAAAVSAAGVGGGGGSGGGGGNGDEDDLHAQLDAVLRAAAAPAPAARFSFMGGRMAAKFNEAAQGIREKKEKARADAEAKLVAAFDRRRPVPWRFADEVGALSSMIWYTRPVEEGGVAQRDPTWLMAPLAGRHEIGPRATALRDGVVAALRRRLFAGAEDGKALMRGVDRDYVVPVQTGRPLQWRDLEAQLVSSLRAKEVEAAVAEAAAKAKAAREVGKAGEEEKAGEA